MSELIIRDSEAATCVGAFTLTRGGLQVTGEPTYDEKKYGDTYTKAQEITGLDKTTLQNLKWVSSVVESSRRHEVLTFGHHQEASSLPPAQADALLARAEVEQLSTRDLRAAVKQIKAAKQQKFDTTTNYNLLEWTARNVPRGFFSTIRN